RRPATIVGSQLRKPAVAEPGQTAQCTVVSASEPDWNRLLNRQRIQPRVGDLVPLALKAEQLLSPELAHDFNLFLGTAAPIFEVLAQRFVFPGIPADAAYQPQATAA